MKKTILTISFMLFSVITFCQYQKTYNDESTFGIRVGFNYPKAENFESVLFEANIGYNLALAYYISLSEKWSMPIEIEYRKASVSSKKADYNLSGVGLNLLTNYFIQKNIFFEIGPSFLYILNPSTDAGRAKRIPNIINPIAEPLNTNNFDFSIALGVGYVIEKNISISLRYNYGFSKSFSYYNDFFDVNSDATSFVGIRGGYNF